MGVFYVKHRNVNENWEENSGCGIPFLAGGGYQKLLGMLGPESVSTGIVLQLLFPFSSSTYVMCELGPVLLTGLQLGDLGWKLFLSQLSW